MTRRQRGWRERRRASKCMPNSRFGAALRIRFAAVAVGECRAAKARSLTHCSRSGADAGSPPPSALGGQADVAGAWIDIERAIGSDVCHTSSESERTTAASRSNGSLPTLSSRRGFSWGATGLLRNLTFARAVGKVNDGDSGRSNVASIARVKISTERLHSKTVYSHCRPVAAGESEGLPDCVTDESVSGALPHAAGPN